MRLFCKVKRLCYQIHFLAVACCQIAVQKMLERVVHQFVFRFGFCFVYAVLFFHDSVFL